MKHQLICILIVCFAFTFPSAQVKIGENVSSIQPNALLELESQDKGFLLPRIAINNLLSSSPLSGQVSPGMMAYSLNGTVPDGNYVWNGTRWNISAEGRDHSVIVKSESDFPSPVNGIIHLVPGTLYQINGAVMVMNKIELHGCTITGMDRFSDMLIYTGSGGEMFTGAHGGAFHNMILTAATPGSKLFNLNAQGELQNLIVEDVFIFNSASVGHIKAFNGFVVFVNCAFSNNGNGITFEDITDVLSINEFWLEDNRNTFQTFTGTFHTIQKQGGRMSTLNTNSGIGIDITGLTNLEVSGYIKNVIFCGNGTCVNGQFSNRWEVESYGLATEKDDVASGNLYIHTPAVTTIPNVNVPVKVQGLTEAVGLFRVVSISNNRLQYTGLRPRRFIVNCALSFISAGNNKVYSFYIAKNGEIMPESKISRKITTGTDQGALALSCTLQVDPDDYIEVWVENNSDNTNLTVLNMNLAVK